MKGSRKTDYGMDEANSSTRTVVTMMANGKRTKCTDGESSTTKVVSSHTRATGLMMSFTATARYITTIQWYSREASIIPILIY